MDVEEGGALSADHGLLLCGTERPGFETLAGGGGVVRTAAWFSISQLFKIPCAKPRNLEEQVSDTLGSGGGGVHRPPLSQLLCSESRSRKRPKGLAQRFYKSSGTFIEPRGKTP